MPYTPWSGAGTPPGTGRSLMAAPLESLTENLFTTLALLSHQCYIKSVSHGTDLCRSGRQIGARGDHDAYAYGPVPGAGPPRPASARHRGPPIRHADGRVA